MVSITSHLAPPAFRASASGSRDAEPNVARLGKQQALLRDNVTLPGGDMREGTRDMYVRTEGEYRSLAEIAATVITVVDGHPIRVGDVAQVVDGVQDVRRLVQVGGLALLANGIAQVGPAFVGLSGWIQLGLTGAVLFTVGIVALIKREEILAARQRLTTEWREWEP